MATGAAGRGPGTSALLLLSTLSCNSPPSDLPALSCGRTGCFCISETKAAMLRACSQQQRSIQFTIGLAATSAVTPHMIYSKTTLKSSLLTWARRRLRAKQGWSCMCRQPGRLIASCRYGMRR